MPPLKVVPGFYGGVDPSTCREVDMDEWDYTAQYPLSTVGAATCLAVVVHNQNQGCLAHVAHSTLNQTELYHKACFSIREMILRIGAANDMQIYLGAGWGFVKGSQYVTVDLAMLDFSEYLGRFLEQMNVTAKIVDCRQATMTEMPFDPGSVLYDPTSGYVCLLMTPEQKYAVQTNLRSATRQRCR